MHADAIVQAAKQLAGALKGNIPPPLVKRGIDHIKALTNIFDTSKAEQLKRDGQQASQAKATPTHSPRVRKAGSAPRVQAPDLPNLISIGEDSDSDD